MQIRFPGVEIPLLQSPSLARKKKQVGSERGKQQVASLTSHLLSQIGKEQDPRPLLLRILPCRRFSNDFLDGVSLVIRDYRDRYLQASLPEETTELLWQVAKKHPQWWQALFEPRAIVNANLSINLFILVFRTDLGRGWWRARRKDKQVPDLRLDSFHPDVLVHVMEALTYGQVSKPLDPALWPALLEALDYLGSPHTLHLLEKQAALQVRLDTIADFLPVAKRRKLIHLQRRCYELINQSGFGVHVEEIEAGQLRLRFSKSDTPLPDKLKQAVALLKDKELVSLQPDKWAALPRKKIMRRLDWHMQHTAATVHRVVVSNTYLALMLLTASATITTLAIASQVHILSIRNASSLTFLWIFFMLPYGVESCFRNRNPHIRRNAFYHRMRLKIVDWLKNLEKAPRSRTSFAVSFLHPDLKELDLTLCSEQLTDADIATIAQSCSGLTHLKLGTTLYVQDWRPLASLRNLTGLHVTLDPTIDPAPLAALTVKEHCPHVEEIEVEIKDSASLQSWPFLRTCPPMHLRLAFSPLDDNGDDRNDWSQVYPACPSLAALDMQKTKESAHLGGIILYKKDISALAKHCPALRSIRVHRFLEGNDDDLLSDLTKSCPNLRCLHIWHAHLSRKGIEKLVLQCPNLEEFFCHTWLGFSHSCLTPFSWLPHLKHLTVGTTEFKFT